MKHQRSFPFQARRERFVVIARAMLASCSLLAIWLDPSEPSRHAELAYTLLGLYTVYSWSILFVVLHRHRLAERAILVTHVLDLFSYSLLVTFTSGPTSPFYLYFVFSLVSAAIRWGERGVRWTLPIALALYGAISIYFAYGTQVTGFDLNTFIIRSSHLVMLGVLFAFMSLHEEKLRLHLIRLAEWTRDPEGISPVEEVLGRINQVLPGDIILMSWDDGEEPWANYATLDRGRYSLARTRSMLFELLLGRDLPQRAFMCVGRGQKLRALLTVQQTPADTPLESPWDTDELKAQEISNLVAARLAGTTVSGWLFILNRAALSLDDLALAPVVAERAATDLEQYYARQRLRRSTRVSERLRVSRDLHDGLLQALTGAALQLKAAVRDGGTDLEGLERVQKILSQEQRKIRHFLTQVQAAGSDGQESTDFAAMAAELKDALLHEWRLTVEFTAPSDLLLRPHLANEVYAIVREACVNVARHAKATRAHVLAQATNDEFLLCIEDDGVGFRIHGVFSEAELQRHGIGPRSIRARVRDLGGEVRLASSARGSKIDIRLPLTMARLARPALADAGARSG